ncbi:hypothetical protein C3K47_16155 [Solitalea longa]|uniref:Uncharacterized protein n=1 Tax=Solitalea longa TaxID=2079460 RepID=A0A2S4ZYF8_9SPHI|nr:hypothetical protein [Solitalea longa]POY35316.1 hypothetical protein C3K47_16155 [Solitalea longa]
MRKCLLLTILFISSLNVFADCTKNELSFWPKQHSINTNSIVLITATGNKIGVLNELNHSYVIYLKSGNEVVKLNAKETFTGDLAMKQSLFTLERNLSPGKTYELKIDINPKIKDPNTIKKLKLDKKVILPKWIVRSIPDTIAPVWQAKPQVLERTTIQLAKGQSSLVRLSADIEESSEYLYKTTLTNSKTGKSTVFYLLPINHQIRIGHNECYGEFVFGEMDDCEATFTLVDESGNETIWNEEAIKLIKP